MEHSREELKKISRIALTTCLRHIWVFFRNGLYAAPVPEGADAKFALATQIVTCVLMLLLLIPDFYIIIKGIMIAKRPDSSKAHIVWATILAGLTVFGILSGISDLVNGGNVVDGLTNILGAALSVLIYIVYSV